jgi:hypothetical protein
VSTAADLVMFFWALLGGRLLPAAMLKEMLTVPPLSQREGYALGIARYVTPNGQTAWGHGGGIGGYRPTSAPARTAAPWPFSSTTRSARTGSKLFALPWSAGCTTPVRTEPPSRMVNLQPVRGCRVGLR